MAGPTSAMFERAQQKEWVRRSARIAILNGVTITPVDMPPTNEAASSLLGIPPELRIMIYRLTLVDSAALDPFVISPSQHQQPGLLRTCRQIRNEAINIFQTENYFATDIIELRPINPHRGHWKYHKNCQGRLRFLVTPSGNKMKWTNLIEWLKMSFEGRIEVVTGPGTIPFEIRVALRAFELMRTLVRSRPAVQWGEVEAALVVWKDTVATVRPDIWEPEDNTA